MDQHPIESPKEAAIAFGLSETSHTQPLSAVNLEWIGQKERVETIH